MDVSDLRKRILRALDEARKEASTRRQATDEAAQAYETFLSRVAVPVVRQAAQVLNATGEPYAVHTPAGSVRLVSEKSAQTFVELTLDATGRQCAVVGRVSLARGREVIVDERPLAQGKSISDLTEEDVSGFLIEEIPKLVVRT
jgi:hypothetical protein